MTQTHDHETLPKMNMTKTTKKNDNMLNTINATLHEHAKPKHENAQTQQISHINQRLARHTEIIIKNDAGYTLTPHMQER